MSISEEIVNQTDTAHMLHDIQMVLIKYNLTNHINLDAFSLQLLKTIINDVYYETVTKHQPITNSAIDSAVKASRKELSSFKAAVDEISNKQFEKALLHFKSLIEDKNG